MQYAWPHREFSTQAMVTRDGGANKGVSREGATEGSKTSVKTEMCNPRG